ncbi:fumarate reductase subunit FrdD [Parendozoicomonas haliclonae]|uniref:Fumarate reductase subunit D n=1 Tax=Parendozoicomonas haliclonae TaxID=1960125 RepID=A0A1X7ANP9_9GAMM|nr:fumarate reductase subunit FrdD [Parendozoicomonas haliclonae]SMA49773.1 Fumarate reductase subunit D [Parendozoicomonas haliclonae]
MSMTQAKSARHIEPLLWSLFGAGGMAIAFLMPAVILIVGLLVPMGILPAEVLSYERLSAFFLESWFGRLCAFVIIVPALWGSIHRVYHGMHDLQIHAGTGIKVFCYGSVLVLTIATVALVL